MKYLILFLATAVVAQDFQDFPSRQTAEDRKFDYDDYLDDLPPPPPRVRGNALGGLRAGDCRSKSVKVPHEKHCDLYYVRTGCDDGQALLRACPNGLVFPQGGRNSFGLIKNCDYPHNVDCGGKTMHNPPETTEHCDWLYGIFGHETSCTRYWTCWNGTATEQFCVGGLLYNEDTHACDWPQNVVGCQKHPLCKDDANGNVPLGKSCTRYWACQGGYPRLQSCPARMVFDKQRKRCSEQSTEDCEIPELPSTTPEPEYDDGVRYRRPSVDYEDVRQQEGRRPIDEGRRPIDEGRRSQGPRGQGRPRPQQLGAPSDVPLPFNIPPPDNRDRN